MNQDEQLQEAIRRLAGQPIEPKVAPVQIPEWVNTRDGLHLMATPWRCETCKWWRPSNDMADIECGNDEVIGIFGDEGQRLPPDFGCVLWTAKGIASWSVYRPAWDLFWEALERQSLNHRL